MNLKYSGTLLSATGVIPTSLIAILVEKQFLMVLLFSNNVFNKRLCIRENPLTHFLGSNLA